MLTLPDPDDRHVLAAAIQGRADVIVTYNLKDFPADILRRHGLEAQHPDAFVISMIEVAPETVLPAVRDHRASLKRPPKSVEEYLQTLDRQSLAMTVAALRAYTEVI